MSGQNTSKAGVLATVAVAIGMVDQAAQVAAARVTAAPVPPAAQLASNVSSGG
ncbi:hypothetical protein [Mycobacterium sp. 1164985.4]|uniref:hypothetical protein n=1 Tax=Mycobacterium sp. 1164985.4 TaxID=1834069 RepID=UPI000B1B5EC8|nr:hypothetical protein [Mycobacterium sp. 1164985.4]